VFVDVLLDWLTAPFDFLNWLTDEIFLFLNGLFDRFGTPIVFFAALVEATVGLGVIFPGVALMFLGGAYAADDPGTLAVVWLIAVIGTILGDTLSYAIGRRGGAMLQGTRFGPTLRAGEALMTGRTRWLIPFYHVASVTRAVGPFGAGAVRMPLRIWMPLDYLGAVISNTLWVGAGALFGTAVLTEDGRLEEHPALRIGLAAVAFIWFYAVQGAFAKRMRDIAATEAARQASEEAPPPPGA
jgi:membrane protein DedA with SNARE-associated domain